MTSAFEQSFKKRLSLIAKERNLTSAEVWQNIITERFLVRLCQSSYQTHFVLKGGMLLARHIDIGRETRDLDFAIRQLSNHIEVLQKAFSEILQIQVDDGFIFTNPTIIPLEHFHMEYLGARVKIDVRFGKSRFPLFVDLGFGDFVQVHEKKFLLLSNSKGPLFEPSIIVQCYPVEFIFAEKLETAVYRGADNSRMKDFHDLYTLVQSEKILKKGALKAIHLVFKHRKTPLNLPIQFHSSVLNILQGYWKRYQRMAVAFDKLPDQISDVIEAVNRLITD